MTDFFDVTGDVIGKITIRDETKRNGLCIQGENVPAHHYAMFVKEAAVNLNLKPIRTVNRDEITPQLVMDKLLEHANGKWITRLELIKHVIPNYAKLEASNPANARLLRNRVSNCIDQFRRAQEAKDGDSRKDGRTGGAAYHGLLRGVDFHDRKNPRSKRVRDYKVTTA